MPNIEITMGEIVQNLAAEISDSCVLVPLFVKVNNLKSKLYKDKNVFTAEIPDTDVATVNSKVENSYAVVQLLLDANLPVVVKPIYTDADFADEAALVTALDAAIVGGAFTEFVSKNIYDIKFITSGAHQNKGFASVMIAIAAARKDAIALVEFAEDDTVQTLLAFNGEGTSSEYAAAFFPWCKFEGAFLPGGVAYLLAYAKSIKSNPDWFAAAGMVRGEIPGFTEAKIDITEAEANALQNYYATGHISVNAIAPQGDVYRIWGNRTTKHAASSDESTETYKKFLNVMVLACDICKAIYRAARYVTFDPNDNVTYLNFVNKTNKTLDKMKYNRGLEWYTWKKFTSASKATIKARVTLKPIEAVENFELGVVLSDGEANIE